MHIVIAILSALLLGFFVIRRFFDVAQEGQEAIRDIRGAYRRGKWSKQADQRLIETIEDPREAAAVLMFQIASYDGAVTDAQKNAITSKMCDEFDVSAADAEELFAFARMVAGQVTDVSNNLRKVTKAVNDACTDDEKKQLLTMLANIAEVEGAQSDIQKRLIADVQRTILPPRN